MTDKSVDALSEMYVGAAVVGAFVLSLLEKKGLIQFDEAQAALKEAVEFVPEDQEGHPRYGPLVSLRLLADAEDLRNALPFPWPADR